MELHHGRYLISTDPALLDAAAVHAYLTTSYWSRGIPLGVVQKALQSSLCIGAYRDRMQIGLVRIISDYATYAYVCDVYVLEDHRRRGLAKTMLSFALSHPQLQGLRSWNLRTRDAHGVYEGLGFKPIANAGSYMVLPFEDVYKNSGTSR